jgi:sulfur carrier protein
MKIQVNSKIQELEDEISLAGLLVKNKVEMPEMVSVQINGEFIKKENFKTTIIKEDDTIDFLYFMGGG